jgi:hypothetical protein
VAVVTVLVAAFVFALYQPWLTQWGSTAAEQTAPMAGDSLVVGGRRWTRSVTIDVPPERVWPWLVQVGVDKGGFYTFDWAENLFGDPIHNADRIHPEWQHRQLGETVHLHPAGGLKVSVFEPGSALGLAGWGTFVLVPIGPERTRLIARGGVPPGAAAAVYAVLMEIPHFVMERRMLIGIKQRAERGRS